MNRELDRTAGQKKREALTEGRRLLQLETQRRQRKWLTSG